MSDRTTEISGANIAVEPSEPSMEDILASIRRIIADDGDLAAQDAAVATPPIPDSHVDIRKFAAVSPGVADQNTILVDAEVTTTDTHIDLEDILILSDNDFESEDLAIPEISETEDTLSDDILIEIESKLAQDSDGIFDIKDTDRSEVFSPKLLHEGLDEKLVSLVNLSSADKTDSLDLASDLDGKFDLSDDLDLILDDDGDSQFSVEDHFHAGSDILDIVEASIANIEAPELRATNVIRGEDNLVAVETTRSFHDIDDTNVPIFDVPDDDIIDLVGDLLNKTQENENIEHLDMTDIEDDTPLSIDLEEIEGISGDEDIDLVKSLMADLTNDTLDDVPEDIAEIPDLTESRRTENDAGVVFPHDDSEMNLVDDILDLAISDELGMDIESAVQVEKVIEDRVEEITSVDDSDLLEEFSISEQVLSDGEADTHTDEEDADAIDETVGSVDASINALLRIAAIAENDAKSAADYVIPHAPEAVVEIDQEPHIESHMEAPVTSDIDAAMTPEIGTENSDLDSIFFSDESGSSGEGLESPSSSAFETILPDPKNVDEDLHIIASRLDIENDLVEVFDEAADPLSSETISDDGDDHYQTVKTAAELIIQSPPTPLEQEPTEMPKLVAKDGIIDDVTETAAAEAFASLNQVVEENTEYQESGPRIGDLVQAALRPMLKEWLDENLKGIVERAVTKEVKRISSGK